ncbi:NAD(P)H-binding protein [Streptomyces capparidis]
MFLVTGPTGNVGRHLVPELLAEGARVRVVAEPGAPWEPAEGVEVLVGDLADPDTQAKAVDGIDGVFLLLIPGAVAGLAGAARRAGVRRIVLLSSLTADEAAVGFSSPLGAAHREAERAVEASGAQWAHLRPNLLMSNALWWAPGIRSGGVVRWPFGDAATSPVHERDIAAVAARALLRDEYAGEVLPLTGPQSLTHREQARIIGEVTGAGVRYEELTGDAGHRELSRLVGEAPADALTRFFDLSVGRGATVLPTVERVTGRPAATFAQWVAEHAAEFGGAAS